MTPPWVLYPSEIMHLGCTEILLARAVFTRSIKVPGWQQPGAPKPRGHDFPEKKRPDFLKFIGLMTALWVLYPSEVIRMGSLRPVIGRAVFASSIKAFRLQPGAQTPGARFSEKKRPDFLKFFGPATPLWVL